MPTPNQLQPAPKAQTEPAEIEQTSEISIKNKRLTAVWNDDYLQNLLFGA